LLSVGATSSAVAQTVQLPTFSYFSVPTTVSVPDQGSTYMGGIKRASSGRNEFGVPMLPFRPFKNTAIGQERSAMQTHMSVRIHDFDEMDQYLLNAPPKTTSLAHNLPPLPGGTGGAESSLVRSHPATSAPGTRGESGAGSSWYAQTGGNEDAFRPPAMSVAGETARREQQQQQREAEARDYYQRGLDAEKDGKSGVARIYYQMAARRASEPLKHEIALKLDAIMQAQTGASFAGR